MEMNKNTKKSDHIRRNLVEVFVVFIVPVISLLLFRQISIIRQGEFLTNEFFTSEIGQLSMVGIVLISAMITGLVYEYLFPKYKDDINW